ncbi:thiamine diphosphokinase [Hoeflea sp. YIM 152468]|uniref:thiamine diphosphokinase n=1 Tax=Hoeflea sp. YIM 152468 TaxID=3031759 RepID=UPI0023DB080D|nr:thiamine diphosphokinase [Hoeflea sp. YIM 152468]MDF1608114.1 thiamine diphosphokinase [Hoeflea sp. YIM 152468]
MTTHSTFAILLGGALEIDDRVRALTQGARAIAADGGMVYAEALGMTPELWVGDFDSTSSTLMEKHAQTERLSFPAEKNLTDGELAIEQAIERGAKRLVLVGAFGGERTDHAVSHLLQALTLAERGLDVVLTSGVEEAFPLLPGSREIDLPAGSLFSVIAFTPLTGLSLSGVKYPLDKADIAFGASRTISNVAGGRLSASLICGRALIVARPHDYSGA